VVLYYIYACNVKPYDILKVKNAMVKSVYSITKYTIFSLMVYRHLIFGIFEANKSLLVKSHE
jgi:hypothetical protein